MEFYERVSGARMHAAFYRPNEMSLHQITTSLLKDILLFCRTLFITLDYIESTLNSTVIWRTRLAHVGTLHPHFVTK